MLKKIKIFSECIEINHFITTRKWWNSVWKYEWLNLALHTGDDDEKVLVNRKILTDNVWKREEAFIYLNQIHSTEVFIAKNNDKWRWSKQIDQDLNYDSVITSEKGIGLMILVADCVPIIIFDTVKKVVWVIHSGWKWTKGQILKKTIDKCIEIYWSNPKDILVWIWPSISQKKYEVWIDVAFNFGNNFYIQNENNKFNLDLQGIIKSQALEIWILENNLEIIDICSFENEDLFFSARRDWLKSWRFWMWIYLI